MGLILFTIYSPKVLSKRIRISYKKPQKSLAFYLFTCLDEKVGNLSGICDRIFDW